MEGGVSSMNRVSGVEEAGQYLRELLERLGPYRCLWEQRAGRLRGTQINQAAVGRVLSEYLWDSGLRSEDNVELPRELKDRVMRALEGAVLTPETLSWFIGAFSISEADASRLWALLNESDQ